MGKLLLLRLEGVWQSWGVRARWDVRDTGLEPSKSGVLGLIGCAMGLARGSEQLLELDARLRFGVRVEHPGRVVTDYQTITDYLPTAAGEWKGRDSRTRSPSEMRAAKASPATVISPRDFLEDAAFLVGLEARENGESLLQAASEALQRPRWPLFLGRKACVPSRPVWEFCGNDYTDIEDAFARHFWSWREGATEDDARERPKPEQPLEAWVETSNDTTSSVESSTDTPIVRRQDVLRLNAARVYDFRFAKRMECVPDNLQEYLNQRRSGVNP